MNLIDSTAEDQREAYSDEQVIDAVLAGNTPLYELLIRRYNQRLYRVLRSILRDDGEAEDVMQEAYVRAYQNLKSFERRARFSTWLTRIAVNEAFARSSRQSRFESLEFSEFGETDMPQSASPSPEQATATHETRRLLEAGILALPQKYRMVLVMRDVEEMSTSETANILEITEEAVKVRLHRAHALLRKELLARAGATSSSAFQFLAPRCNRVTDNVMERIARL